MADQRTVLIVDDEKNVRLLLRATLGRDRRLRVVEAASGPQGLALASTIHPDLVLLDIGLPGMDGYAVCRAIKLHPETAGVKVVMVTAQAQKNDEGLSIAAGADGYIAKPFSPMELMSTVHQALDG